MPQAHGEYTAPNCISIVAACAELWPAFSCRASVQPAPTQVLPAPAARVLCGDVDGGSARAPGDRSPWLAPTVGAYGRRSPAAYRYNAVYVLICSNLTPCVYCNCGSRLLCCSSFFRLAVVPTRAAIGPACARVVSRACMTVRDSSAAPPNAAALRTAPRSAEQAATTTAPLAATATPPAGRPAAPAASPHRPATSSAAAAVSMTARM